MNITGSAYSVLFYYSATQHNKNENMCDVSGAGEFWVGFGTLLCGC